MFPSPSTLVLIRRTDHRLTCESRGVLSACQGLLQTRLRLFASEVHVDELRLYIAFLFYRVMILCWLPDPVYVVFISVFAYPVLILLVLLKDGCVVLVFEGVYIGSLKVRKYLPGGNIIGLTTIKVV